jgi:hypothetical protein
MAAMVVIADGTATVVPVAQRRHYLTLIQLLFSASVLA